MFGILELFDYYLPNTYYVPGTVPGSNFAAMNKTAFRLIGLHSWVLLAPIYSCLIRSVNSKAAMPSLTYSIMGQSC